MLEEEREEASRILKSLDMGSVYRETGLRKSIETLDRSEDVLTAQNGTNCGPGVDARGDNGREIVGGYSTDCDHRHGGKKDGLAQRLDPARRQRIHFRLCGKNRSEPDVVDVCGAFDLREVVCAQAHQLRGWHKASGVRRVTIVLTKVDAHAKFDCNRQVVVDNERDALIAKRDHQFPGCVQDLARCPVFGPKLDHAAASSGELSCQVHRIAPCGITDAV